MCLPEFDVIDGYVVDSMHCIDLGVTRNLVSMWFDNSGELWYIGRHVEEINKRLKLFRPPNYIHRLARPITERKFWKASEWRNFLIFYSLIVMKGILPQKYLLHFMLLVDSVHLLQRDNISQLEVCYAEKMLQKFVKDYESLYRRENMTYNLHLLLHAPNSVRYWGPLWGYSNYTFENMNGVLTKMYHGTQAVAKQICNTFYLFMNMKNMSFSEYNVIKPCVCTYLDKCNGYAHIKQCTLIDGCNMIGAPLIRALTCLELHSARELLDCDLQANGYFYSKTICYGKLFNSTHHNRARDIRRNNYTCLMSNGKFGEIASFCVVKKTEISSDSECLIVFVHFIKVSRTESVIGSHPECTGASAKHIYVVTGIETETRAVKINALQSKCITYSDRNKSYICVSPGENFTGND